MGTFPLRLSGNVSHASRCLEPATGEAFIWQISHRESHYQESLPIVITTIFGPGCRRPEFVAVYQYILAERPDES